jgi:hypothetical protein
MTAIPGLAVTAPIVPKDTADVYPTHDEAYGKGGFRSVADNTARDAISAERRVLGMLVFVTGTSKFWQLRGGVADVNWVELNIPLV